MFKNICKALTAVFITGISFFGCSVDNGTQPTANLGNNINQVAVVYGSARELAINTRPGGQRYYNIGLNSGVNQYDGSQWVPFFGNKPSQVNALKIASGDQGPGADAILWVVAPDFSISYYQVITWHYLTGQAREIATYSNDPLNNTFIVGCALKGSGNYYIYKFNGINWSYFPNPSDINTAASAIKIAVDNNGYPWIIKADNSIQRWNGSSWSPLSGGAREISINAGGTVFIVGCPIKDGGNYYIYKFNGTNWSYFPDPNNASTCGSGVKIAVDVGGNPWITKANNTIWAWNGSAWIQK